MRYSVQDFLEIVQEAESFSRTMLSLNGQMVRRMMVTSRVATESIMKEFGTLTGKVSAS
jgi:hypothetical protein